MLQKRLEYGFSGYQVPFIPKAARSSRRRGLIRENAVEKEPCAFDLLATVAGKLLEGETSQSAPLEKDWLGSIQDVVMAEQDEGNLLEKDEKCDKHIAATASVNLELGLQVPDQDYSVKETPVPQNDALSAPTSVLTSSHCLEKDDSLVKMDINDDKSEGCDPGLRDAFIPDVDEIVEQHDGKIGALSSNEPDLHSSENAAFYSEKPPQVASSDCSIKLSLGVDHYPCGSLLPRRDYNNNHNSSVNVVTRDDDENFSECTQPSTKKAARMPARIGDRRIRKLLASKYWRAASQIKDGDLSDTDLRCIYRSRRTGFKRQRSQRIYPFKKRKKFYNYSSLSNSSGDTGYKGVYNSPVRRIDQTVSAFSAIRHGVNGSSSCDAVQSTAFASRESHVKLRIKSFRVPELFIEMPETATVGSLKRTVMEAVTALIGGGLHVGMLLQGKKIRDDNRTLVQSGICHDSKLESLGFTLEPNASLASNSVCSEDDSHMVSTDVHLPLSRCPTSSANHEGVSSHDHHLVTNLGNLVESDHDSAPSPAETTAEKGGIDSQALVALPDGSPEALAVVPAHQKSKRSEMAQRRIRRPFSVTEVEALVEAVEKLGTGRWRDVKLCAFENVKHRTYVDLKDKWKTLVHTAKISPHQRRGEPVPQVLLDRVLAAHSYWSEQQAKQQLKQPSDSCLL